MHHSIALQNLFARYEYELVRCFCDCSGIYLFVQSPFPYFRSIQAYTLGGKVDFKDHQTFYFHLHEGTVYGGKNNALVVFKHSEDEIINKFHKFIRLKAFL